MSHAKKVRERQRETYFFFLEIYLYIFFWDETEIFLTPHKTAIFFFRLWICNNMKRARKEESKEFLDLVSKSIRSSSEPSSIEIFDEDRVRSIIETALKSLAGEIGEKVRSLVREDFESNVKYLTKVLNDDRKTINSKKKKRKKNDVSLESAENFADAVNRRIDFVAKLPIIPSCMWIHNKMEQMGKTGPSDIHASDILDCFRDDSSGCRQVSGLAMYAERFRHYLDADAKLAIGNRDMSSLLDLRKCCESFFSILILRATSVVPTIESGGMYVPVAADWRAAAVNMSTSRKQLVKSAFGSVSPSTSQDWRSDLAYVISMYVWICASMVFLESDEKKRKRSRKTWFEGPKRTVFAVLETNVHIGYVLIHLCSILDQYVKELKRAQNEDLSNVWSTLFHFFVSLENMIGRVPPEHVKSDGLRYLLRLIALRQIRDVFESHFRGSLEKKMLRKTLRWIQETQSVYVSIACPKELFEWLSSALSGEAKGISRRTASPFAVLIRDANAFDANTIFRDNSLSSQQLNALTQLYAGHCFGEEKDEHGEEEEDEDEKKDEEDAPMFFIDSVGSERARAQTHLLRSAMVDGDDDNEASSATWHDSTQRLMEEISSGEEEED